LSDHAWGYPTKPATGMRNLLLFTILILLSASPFTLAQKFAIGAVDYYGFKKVRKDDVNACLTFKTGDTVDIAVLKKVQILACMEKVGGVVQADIGLVCCDESTRLMLFVGISEVARPALSADRYIHDVSLPDRIIVSYDSLMTRTFEAVEKGSSEEDNSDGHALLKYAPAIKYQQEQLLFANQQIELLREVLKNSRFEKHREVAAWIIAYHTDKKAILRDLQAAAEDPDEGVRNNAVRALGILINYSQARNLNLEISPDPFIRMMNSVTWTDRNKAGFVLLAMTNSIDKPLLSKLRKAALDPLVDMALWKSKGHSTPGYIILCRIAGWTGDKVTSNMDKDRTVVVKALLQDINKLPD
jgi:hypothetical protein